MAGDVTWGPLSTLHSPRIALLWTVSNGRWCHLRTAFYFTQSTDCSPLNRKQWQVTSFEDSFLLYTGSPRNAVTWTVSNGRWCQLRTALYFTQSTDCSHLNRKQWQGMSIEDSFLLYTGSPRIALTWTLSNGRWRHLKIAFCFTQPTACCHLNRKQRQVTSLEDSFRLYTDSPRVAVTWNVRNQSKTASTFRKPLVLTIQPIDIIHNQSIISNHTKWCQGSVLLCQLHVWSIHNQLRSIVQTAVYFTVRGVPSLDVKAALYFANSKVWSIHNQYQVLSKQLSMLEP